MPEPRIGLGGQHRQGVWTALADPNRRHIVEMLTTRGPSTATRLAGELSISRQATAKHLGLLTDAGLTASSRRGRETHYRLELETLAEVTAWVQQVESQWSSRLSRLTDHINK